MQHAVATVPTPVVPSNTASFQSCINSTTSSSSSQFPPDNISDPSLLTGSMFQQPATEPPGYDYSSFPHSSTSSSAEAADTKPGWPVLGGDVLNDLASSAGYAGAADVTSGPQRGPHQTAPRAAKRMSAPRFSAPSTHMHAGWLPVCIR